jgi:DNA (cytosine-5)-methyltransferase 1
MSKNKIKGVSLFSSAGLAELYFEKINVEINVANELIKKRCDLYKYLYPSTQMICGDIQEKKIKNQIIKLSKDKDFLIATPPCQGFSTLGITKKTSSLMEDQRNFLIFDVIEIIKKCNFKYVLIENVPRSLKLFYPYEGDFYSIEYILNKIFSKKYEIKVDIYDAKDFGVAQFRKRSIIRMYTKDKSWPDPKKDKKIITLKDSIGHLPSLESGESSRINYHNAKKHNERDILALKHTPEGKSALLNEIYYPKREDGQRISGFHNTYKRMRWDEPAKARTTNCGNIGSHNNVHPGRKLKNGTYSDARVLSLLETFIVSSIPENISLPEWASDAFVRKMIGEAIPPLMCKKILEPILKNNEV